ncbi:MAG: phosphoglycerate dehydrogenase [Pirellulales bacterium]|jgi:D-3-phosphoglycerate dehydrogenase|nr:phosphoglycerate dehydrogenase [Thermoguttaceae bacterium]MDD4785661.1 phosphoglycerate dehydrogenase [Pirellulales bacterium]MDI9446873.1 phosphoglycerate dehydrogenase [Planctomycetota bacterium]NLZ00604.1 phosphoglycerate dehydrogenase [Pirellulaceae bacterium]
MPRVIVLDPLSEDGLQLLKAAGNIEFEVRTGLSGEDLRQALAEFDGAICRSGVKITAQSLAGNRRLKAIARAGVGTDNIDKEAATRLGIVVMNTPGGNTISTAEQTIALMLALSRNLHPAYQSLIEGRWDRKKYIGAQLAGKTLGIIGLGRIGQAVAARALAFEMKVLAHDPFLSAQRAKELGVKACDSPKEMLPDVDYLTVHTPLNDQTRNLIGSEEIKLLKPGARLINCARGGIYNEQALVEGLKNGQIAGVALDVFESEPCTSSPLFGMPGVVCTPHLGASTEEAQACVALEAAELLIDFFTTGAIKQSVNMSPLDPKTLEAIRSYLNVAYRLGMLLAQIDHVPPTACKVSYQGEVCRRDTSLLTAAFAAGLVQHAMDCAVNIVNAEILLRERGIELVEERSAEPGEFSSLITAQVTSEQKVSKASATLFGALPRLVRKCDYRVDTPLEGILLFFYHHDTPGVIGKVGAVFGKHRVNIAQMSVGRVTNQPGGQAVGVLALDSQPPAEAIAELLSLDPIHRASIVRLPAANEMPPWMGG